MMLSAASRSHLLSVFLGQLDQRSTHGRVGDLREGAHEPQRLRIYCDLSRHGSECALRALRLLVLEQCAYVHAEDRGHLIEPAAPHSIAAGLILLHLLEADAESVCQLALRHLLGQPLDTDVATTDLVDLLSLLLEHAFSPHFPHGSAPGNW